MSNVNAKEIASTDYELDESWNHKNHAQTLSNAIFIVYMLRFLPHLFYSNFHNFPFKTDPPVFLDMDHITFYEHPLEKPRPKSALKLDAISGKFASFVLDGFNLSDFR